MFTFTKEIFRQNLLCSECVAVTSYHELMYLRLSATITLDIDPFLKILFQNFSKGMSLRKGRGRFTKKVTKSDLQRRECS